MASHASITSSSSTSTSPSSSFFPPSWRSVATAAGLTLALSLTAAIVRYSARRKHLRPENEDDMPSLESIPTSTSTSASNSSSVALARSRELPVVPYRRWSAAEFDQAASQFLEQLGSQGRIDQMLEAQLRQALPQVIEFNNETRALAAHLLLATNAQYLTESTSEKEFDQLMAKQQSDMKQAWQLLDCPSSPEQSRALDVMRVQVAQCMRDPLLMLPIFERMTDRPIEELSDEELILLFTTAPLLGRWDQTVALGDRLSSMHDLTEFHSAPMDYQILYELAKVERAKGNTPVEQLKWVIYKIVCQRIKLRKAECEDQAMVQSIEEEFSHEGQRIWKVMQMSDSLRFVRCGALAQVRSFSPIPLSLVGPASDDRLYVQGYAFLSDSPGQGPPTAKQTETYDLKLVQRSELDSDAEDFDSQNALYWKGTFEMVQEPCAPEEAKVRPTFKCTFDFELTIVKLAQ